MHVGQFYACQMTYIGSIKTMVINPRALGLEALKTRDENIIEAAINRVDDVEYMFRSIPDRERSVKMLADYYNAAVKHPSFRKVILEVTGSTSLDDLKERISQCNDELEKYRKEAEQNADNLVKLYNKLKDGKVSTTKFKERLDRTNWMKEKTNE